MNRIRQFKFVYVILLLCTSHVSMGDVRISKDLGTGHHAENISYVESVLNPDDDFRWQVGASINKISSEIQLESNNRKSIYPVYLLLNIGFNKPVTPLLEIGIDLGDQIIDEISNANGEHVDWYYMMGLSVKLNRQLSLDLYRKKYKITYVDTLPYIPEKVDLLLSGVAIRYQF